MAFLLHWSIMLKQPRGYISYLLFIIIEPFIYHLIYSHAFFVFITYCCCWIQHPSFNSIFMQNFPQFKPIHFIIHFFYINKSTNKLSHIYTFFSDLLKCKRLVCVSSIKSKASLYFPDFLNVSIHFLSIWILLNNIPYSLSKLMLL